MIMWMTIYIQFRRYLNPENAFHGNCYELSTIPEQRFKSLRSTSDILRCTRLRIHPPWSAYSLGDSIFHSTGYANVNGASSDYSNARIAKYAERPTFMQICLVPRHPLDCWITFFRCALYRSIMSSYGDDTRLHKQLLFSIIAK